MSEAIKPIRMRERRARRASLLGWIKWVFVLLPPFYVAFQEVYVNTQTRNNDYLLLQLNNQIREENDDLKELQSEEASLLSLQTLEKRVSDIGLVKPVPNQFQTIFFDPVANLVLDGSRVFELAQTPTLPLRRRLAPDPSSDSGLIAEALKVLTLPGAQATPAPSAGTALSLADAPVAGAASLDDSEQQLLGVF